MSGGSFNYACFKVEDSEIFKALEDVRGIEVYLRTYGQHDAADEVLRFINEVETHQRRLAVIGERIAPLLKAVEWCASGDSGMDGVEREYFALMGMKSPGESS
jgi:hypothetical protein